MAHAFRNTLLARLGFNDPDAKSEEHELACMYLSADDRIKSLARKLIGDPLLGGELRIVPKGLCAEGACSHPDAKSELVVRVSEGVFSARTSMEFAVSKGAGQYKTTIGFLDIYSEASIGNGLTVGRVFRRRDPDGRHYHCDGALDHRRQWMCPPPSPGPSEPGEWILGVQRGESDWWVAHAACVRNKLVRDRESTIIAIEVKSSQVQVSEILKQIALYREYVENAHWFLAACYPLSPHDAEILRAHSITPIQLGAKFSVWRDALLENSSTDTEPAPPEEL